jgi:ribose transport system ATP-binding protein
MTVATDEGSPSLLTVRGLTKSFNGVRALEDVSFDLRAGEVLGLAGHNGAGKSTLLNILSGVLPPDEGTMQLAGSAFKPASYSAATKAGVFRIYQELSVVDNLTVAENLTLGTERHIRRFAFLSPKHTSAVAAEFLREVGLGQLDVDAPVDELTLAERQLLEIVKALYMARLGKIEKPVLLLDEPTSGLTAQQVLFFEEHVNTFRKFMGIILTTHRGSELLRWSDRILVLRDGADVGTPDPRLTSPEELARLMIGATSVIEQTRHTQAPAEGTLLETRDLRLPALEAPVNLRVRPGEVVALVGEAEEKTQIARCIAGVFEAAAGDVWVDAKRVPAGVRNSLAAGIRFVPADRGGEGLSLAQSVEWNLSIGAISAEGQQNLARQPKKEREFTENLVAIYRVKVADVEQPAGSLSGGNQQKLLVARAMSGHARIIVLEKPTRGIDVHAKSEILRLIVEAASRGVAVVIATDEPEEFMPICDRLIAFRDGLISAEFDCRSGNEPSLTELSESMS